MIKFRLDRNPFLPKSRMRAGHQIQVMRKRVPERERQGGRAERNFGEE